MKNNLDTNHFYYGPGTWFAGVTLLAGAVLFQAGAIRADSFDAPGSGSDDEAWVDLFNGEDLEGWVNVNSAPETWSVRDGMLHCTGKPISALRTERQYENFILELEWRHLTDGGNSGIFLWASPLAAPGVPFLRSIEAQVLDHGYGEADWFTTHGDVFPIHGSTMTPFPPSHGMRSFPSEERSRGFPEWNHYRIECIDGVIRLHVNGKEVSGGTDANYRKGYIALEAEGAPIDFRNLRLLELPGSGAPPEKTAPKAQGHRTLYTGTDLRGWRTAGEDEAAGAALRQSAGRWQVDDWRLRLNEGADEGRTLWTTDGFSDAEFIVDCRPAAASDSDNFVAPIVYLRGESGDGVPVSLDAVPGSWHRFTIRIRGDRVTVFRGDPAREIDAFDLPEGTADHGAFGLADVPGAFEFANLYVRELE